MSQPLTSSVLSTVSQLEAACHMDRRHKVKLQQLLHRSLEGRGLVVEEPAGSSARAARSQPPPVSPLRDIECRIVGAIDNVIAPIVTSLPAMKKRLSEIELRQ
ncbi:hypothetical protein CJ030_MR2G022267 [Morella rubra]|uniref:Uncharacterized protein n=1 Tax=Morella rubra TaxID=262757 RepID=A0A6A1WEJ3_9ROSI|nr:hypothetical protein CJ030_MR2G022264 [Morella rubra]KAB1222776.1 hypothetical protein CJ030_MR2G022267 [Morella rubra]